MAEKKKSLRQRHKDRAARVARRKARKERRRNKPAPPVSKIRGPAAPKLSPHLGGHGFRCHLDPQVFAYLKKRFAVRTMVDVGCGTGGMVEYAARRGVEAVGIDGDFTIERPAGMTYVIHDFTKGPLRIGPFDLAWCVEFLEHVHEEYIDNYFSVFTQCRAVFCTASRNTKGHHHVNVHGAKYWGDVFGGRGFVRDAAASLWVRDNSGMKRDFVRETGTVWINTNMLD